MERKSGGEKEEEFDERYVRSELQEDALTERKMGSAGSDGEGRQILMH